MKVFKCGESSPATQPVRYSGADLKDSAPEGVYKHYESGSGWRYIVLISDSTKKRAVIYLASDGKSLMLGNPTTGNARYVRVGDAKLFLEIRE